MNKQALFNRLWEKYLSDQKMTAGEIRQLRALIQDEQHRAQLQQLLDDLYASEQPADSTETSGQEAFAEVWAALQTTAQETRVMPLRSRTRWWQYAAAVLLVCVMAAGIYRMYHGSKTNLTAQQNALPSPVIQPGTDKALLTLADGSVISLNEAQQGTVAQQGNTRVVKLANGQLAYQADAGAAAGLYNTIQTPRGGKYHLTLPDGSAVWLNAASSLRYPTAFTGATREVTLNGEAYFEIAKNAAMPFRVQVNNMQVDVLGTDFNIMAYAEEASIQTTLLRGSVKINSAGKTQLLSPGQRASFNRSNNILQLQQADTEEAIAWKNNLIQFAGTDIHAAMRMIERWYDVTVQYQGNIPDAHFRGSLSSNAPISAILNLMQQTGEVHFTVSGRKIIVTP